MLYIRRACYWCCSVINFKALRGIGVLEDFMSKRAASRVGLPALLLILFLLSTSSPTRANEATDSETGSSYYVYDDSDGGGSGDVQSASNDGVFNYNDTYLNSRDDALMDEALANQMNLDENGNPFVIRLASGNKAYREIALTFDDGPHPVYTSKILSILQHYRIRATFFMVGYMANRNPHWAKQVAQLGNEIGNHTYDHFRLTSLPDDEIVYQIKQTQDVLYQITGHYPRFIRPPGGRYDQTVLQRLADNGLAVALWTYNTKDLDVNDPNAIYNDVMKSLDSGSIILMHDGSDVTIEVLPRIIEEGMARGYKFVTLSEVLEHSGLLRNSSATDTTPSSGYEDWRISSN
jgi:peptidoglycan-N-acetylglucosamine deacetylase